MTWELAAAIVAGLGVTYRLIDLWWRARMLRLAVRRLRLAGHGSSGAVPTPLTGGPFAVAVTFRGLPVSACPLGCAGPGQPCWEYCPEASTRNFPA